MTPDPTQQTVGEKERTLSRLSETPECDHNCIPIRKWFRSGWVCVRCNRFFKSEPHRA